MVVGIGKILKFNRKCTIVVGLLFAVIFVAITVVPGQANEDGFTDGVSSQITIDTVNRNNILNTHSDAYYENVNQFLALKGRPINQISATDIHITQNTEDKQLMLGQIWGVCYINQTIPITAMYFDGHNETPIVGANISFHITDSNTNKLYQILYADTDSNGFASVDFIPQEASIYEIKASVIGETGNFAYACVWVEPFVHSYKEYIFPQNTIQTVKYTLLDKDLNPIDNVVNFKFGSVNENISPLNGTIEYSINSSTISHGIKLNNSFSGGVDPLDYIIDITNGDVLTTPGTIIPYFMRVFEINDTPVPNTNFTIYVEWRDFYWDLINTTTFNVTTNNYGLSEFEIAVPSGFFMGDLYITEKSEFNNGPCYGNNYCMHGIIDNSTFYGGVNGFNFDINVSDREPNYNEQITITIQLHNSSTYYSNIPVYLYVDGNSEKLITNSTGEANFTFTPQPTFGTHMIYATADIPDEGGLWFRNSGFIVCPADPYIDLSLNGNIVNINVNMMNQSQNLIPNSPAVLEFVRTTTMCWQYISDDILSKYIQPASGTYSDQITLNKYGKYEGHVGWGYYGWCDTVIYTPFEYSTDLDDNFTSGQENQIYINVKKNGTPLTSGNVYLKGYYSKEEFACDFHDFAPVDLNGNTTLTFSPQPYIEGVYITIGVATENETYDLLVDKWIEPEEPPDPPYVMVTSPEDLATNVEIDTNITATFSIPMNSSTLNNNTVEVYINEKKISGDTFEDTNGSWNSANFQGFTLLEELAVWQIPIDDTHRTIFKGYLTYSTQSQLRDYQVYSNEGIEVGWAGNYTIIGWLGDENVVIQGGTGDWIISKLVFEQNSTDTKTLDVGETWDLGDGYSLKLLELDVDGNEAWLALYNLNGEIDNEVCQNQSACVVKADLGGSDDSPIFVTYLNKVNLTQSYIELKYTWLISQDTTEIQSSEHLGDFKVTTLIDRIILKNYKEMFLMRGNTIPLFDDYKFEVEDTPTVRYRLVHQTEPPLEGDVSYSSSSNTVTFDPVSNLNENTDYFPLITTGAEDLAGNSLIEDYVWTFRTIDATPPIITDLNTVVTSSTATITWNTIGDPSNSTVKYNESGNLTILEKIDPRYSESHAIHLDFLKANTTYYYSVVSTDQSGNTNESSLQTFTTLTIPTVTIHSPPIITNDSTPLLNATFDRIVVLAWYVLDEGLGGYYYYTDYLIINIPKLSDGPHRVVVNATDYEGDNMGNIGTAIQDFIVDSTLPIATITEPVEGAFIEGTLDINGTANDTNFKNYKLEWKNSSSAWIEIQNSTEPVIDEILGSWNTFGLEDDDYTIRLIATDNASNSNMTLVTVTIDKTPPTAIITQPEEGAYIRGTININGTANDANFQNYTLEWKNFSVDWTEIHNSTVPVSDGTLATWNTDNLEDGDYSIRLTVADNASNSNITMVNVTIDNTPPEVNTVTLDTITPIAGDEILVTVNTTDNNTVTNVTANGIALSQQYENIWNGTITALGGPNVVNISSRDAAGNVVWNNFTSYTSISANVIFILTNNTSSPLEGATVSLHNIKNVTNADGTAVFTNVAFGDYKYRVRMKGYKRTAGIISVNNYTVEKIELVPKK